MGTIFASGASLDQDGKVLPVVDVRAPSAMPPGAEEAPEPGPGSAPAAPPAGDEPEQPDALPPADPLPDDDDTPDEEDEGAEPVAGREGRPTRRERRRTYVQGVIEENRWLRSQIEQRQHAPGAPQPEQAPPPQDPTEPQEAWYGTTGEYVRAYASWTANKLDEQRRFDAATADAVARWQVRYEEGVKKYQDYDAVQARVEIARHLAGDFAETIRAQSTGADIMYYLGTHRQDLEALNRMDTRQALVWLGDLQARLRTRGSAPTNGQAAPPRRTQPPPHQPMAPVVAGGAQPVTGFRSDMSLTEYAAMRGDQRKALGLRP